MIVLDSSAAVDFILGFPDRDRWVRDQLAGEEENLHAPHVFDVEVFGTVRRLVQKGDLPARRGAEAVHTLRALRLTRYPHWQLLGRMWELRETVAAPDASYVALAEALDARLVTTDGPLARSHGHRARIVGYPAA